MDWIHSHAEAIGIVGAIILQAAGLRGYARLLAALRLVCEKIERQGRSIDPKVRAIVSDLKLDVSDAASDKGLGAHVDAALDGVDNAPPDKRTFWLNVLKMIIDALFLWRGRK